jgi:hypothetical protein
MQSAAAGFVEASLLVASSTLVLYIFAGVQTKAAGSSAKKG